MSKISAFLELHRMLRVMERDIGLQELTAAERDVFLAAHDVTDAPGEAVTSDQIRQHELASSLAQATYHRALRSLVDFGLLQKAEGYKTGLYVVRGDLAES